jgi:hypothetical protein
MSLNKRELEPFEQHLKFGLENQSELCFADDDQKGSNRFWTKSLISIFNDYAPQDCKQYPSEDPIKPEKRSEYLWDITWIKDDGKIWQPYLVCEMEWSGDPREVLYDFRKITMTTARYRVMVFDRTAKNIFDDRIQMLQEATPTDPNACYLGIGVKSIADLTKSPMVLTCAW